MLPVLLRSVRSAAQSSSPVLMQTARGMATAAASMSLPAPPVQLSGTSANIATLTWQCAVKEKAMDKVQDELRQMAYAVQTLPELRRLATDPFVPALVRNKLVANLMESAPETTQITKRLLEALSDENALAAVPAVSAAFDELVLAHKKEVHVTIVTAQPMDKMERAEVRKQAEKFVEPGFKLVAQEKVDRKIQGGFILEFEDRLVDLSTSKKVSEFNNLVTKLENDLK